MRHLSRFLPPAVALAAIVLALGLLPGTASGAGAAPSSITVSGPASATLGQQVTVQAKLFGGNSPISKATIDFVLPSTFLGQTGDVLVGQAVTDNDGLANVTFEARTSGSVTVKAVYHGDSIYAASDASVAMSVTGNHQLYSEGAGVAIRGLNTAPAGSSDAWPHWDMSGWPIAAILILVWSLYAAAVYFMSRISAAVDSGEAGPMEVSR